MPVKYYTQKFELKAREPVYRGRLFVSFIRSFDCMYMSIGLKHQTRETRKKPTRPPNILITINGNTYTVDRYEMDIPFHQTFSTGSEINFVVSNYNKRESFNAMIVFRGYEK